MVDYEKYKVRIPYPKLEDYTHNGKVDMEKFNTALHKYLTEEENMMDIFKKDLFKVYGVEGNPKADHAFSLSYQYGHAEGFSEIEWFFQDLVDLIKDLEHDKG